MIELKLALYLGFDTTQILKAKLPENFELIGASFLELENVKGILQNVNWILINLSDLAKTDPLNDTAIRKWRDVFSDLVQKSVAANGRYAQLIGVAESPEWAMAERGVAIGARDLVLIRNVAARLQAVPSSSLMDRGQQTPDNVVAFRDPKGSGEHPPLLPEGKVIPLNTIPVPIRGLEGQSKAIEHLRNLIRKCAPSNTTLLISGETGVGKEHIARAIHENSLQAQKTFRVVHCSEINENNFDTLFRPPENSGGTILIDQIDSLSIELQSRLVSFLIDASQDSSMNSKPRILVSTQAELKDLCAAGKFREDLYFRINVIEIAIPALRYRRSDFDELSDSLMARIARRHNHKRLPINIQAFEKILHYEWPGNIRELENVLEHASLSAWSHSRIEIGIDDLPDHLRHAEMNAGQRDSLKEAVRRFEREHISKTLTRFGGAKEIAAEALGMSLASLYRKLGTG